MDLHPLYESWQRTAETHNLEAYELGQIAGWPLLFLKDPRPAKKRLLLCAGTHGDEPAGAVALAQWAAERLPLPGVAVSFLPIMNPTGLIQGTRDNQWGEPTNRGWINPEPGEVLSREGHLIMRKINSILDCASDGCLTLHEDFDGGGFYVYCYATHSLESFQQHLVATGAKHFPLWSGFYEPDKVNIVHGIAETAAMSSFEDYMFAAGALWVATIETPSKAASLEKRVRCQMDAIDAFVYWCKVAP